MRSGYTTEHVLTTTVTMVQGNWADFHTRALELVSTVPGVQQPAFAWGVPLTGNNWPGSVEIEGRPVASPSDRVPTRRAARVIHWRRFGVSDAPTRGPVRTLMCRA